MDDVQIDVEYLFNDKKSFFSFYNDEANFIMRVRLIKAVVGR